MASAFFLTPGGPVRVYGVSASTLGWVRSGDFRSTLGTLYGEYRNTKIGSQQPLLIELWGNKILTFFKFFPNSNIAELVKSQILAVSYDLTP